MTVESRTRKVPYVTGCLGLLGLTALIALIWFGRLLLVRSRGMPPVVPEVSIRQPLQGARLSLEHGVVVVLEARGPEPILRYELWVDGARWSILTPSDSAPELTHSGQIRWVPDEEGVHVLVALAVDERGLQGRSSPMVVEAVAGDPKSLIGVRLDVQPGDTLASLSERSGLEPDLLDSLSPGDLLGEEVIVPVPRHRLPPGYFGEGGAEPAASEPSPPEPAWAPPAGMPLPVAAITAVSAGSCQVALVWQLVGPVSSARVYRFGGLAEDFSPIADIESGESEYVDTIPWGGSYLYIVSTVNRQGETAGPMTRVEVTAEDCPNEASLPETGTAWLQFEGHRLIVDEAFDRLYCYFSLDGKRYQRIPAGKDSSLAFVGDGWDLAPYLAGINRRVFEHDVEIPVSVRLECWGWRGSDLVSLGNLEDLRPKQDWQDDLTGAGARITLLFGLGSYHNDLPPLTQHLTHVEGHPPSPWHLSLGLSPLECLAHVNRRGGEDLYGSEGVLSQWACLEIPEIMLAWDWPSEEGWELDDIDGYSVEVIEDYEHWDPDIPGSGNVNGLGASGSANMAFPINHMPGCLQEFGFRVSAFRETDDGRVYSDKSPILRVSPPDCPDLAVVEFDMAEIVVRDLDDGCILFCGGESLQAYGSGQFFIHTEWPVIYGPEILFWSEECGAGFGEGCLAQPRRVRNGTIDLAQEDLRRCQGGGCTELGPGNNKVRLVLKAGDSVEFRFVLWDVDGVEDDVWCGTIEDIGLRDRVRRALDVQDFETVTWIIGEGWRDRDLERWAEADFSSSFSNTSYPALSDHDSKCTVKVNVKGLGLYRGGSLYGGN